MRQIKLATPNGPVWVDKNFRGPITMNETNPYKITSTQYPESFTMIDSDTIEINGVKYKKVEKPKPETLLGIIRQWNDDDENPPCEDLVTAIERNWLPGERNSTYGGGYYDVGWNDCLEFLKKKLR